MKLETMISMQIIQFPYGKIGELRELCELCRKEDGCSTDVRPDAPSWRAGRLREYATKVLPIRSFGLLTSYNSPLLSYPGT